MKNSRQGKWIVCCHIKTLSSTCQDTHAGLAAVSDGSPQRVLARNVLILSRQTKSDGVLSTFRRRRAFVSPLGSKPTIRGVEKTRNASTRRENEEDV